MAKEMNMEALNASLRMIEKQGERNLELLYQQDPVMAEKVEQANTLLKNETFIAEFLAADSVEEVIALFAGHGVAVSEEEATALGKYIVMLVNKLIENGGELTEEELEQVAGGWSWGGFLAGAGAGATGGAIFGSMVGAGGIGAAVGAVVGGLIGGFGEELGKLGKWFKKLF